MKIIRGFAEAKTRLSREVVSEFGSVSPSVAKRLEEIFGKPTTAEEAVAQIIRDIRAQGDQAILDYTFKIDGYKPSSLEVSKEEIKAAYSQVDPKLVDALKLAAQRIYDFHAAQKENIFHGVMGDDWGQITRPLNRVGLYSPGGTATYPSAVLMSGIPAKVAGVNEIILTTPPRNRGSIPPATLVAADIAGVHRVFAVGGAQAIAALAYGTESIPRVDKICGPGNIFVTLAKKAVYGSVDIDALQGPSEVLIIADETADPVYCAADLMAQAEHDTMAELVLVCTSEKLAEEISKELEKQLAAAARKKIAAESLENTGVMVIVNTLDEAVKLSNLYAPEHLELLIKDAESYVNRITSAGCIFVGEYSPVPMGDYIAGPNHSLPTGGTAKFSSPLNVCDYVKFIDVVKINRAKMKEIGPSAVTIAMAEGLEAHAAAIQARLKKLS